MHINTLGDALPAEIERVQELLVIYDAIPTGIFAASMMRNSLREAIKALACGDVLRMLQAYEDLKGYA